ncbi:hypothetical protein Sango_2001300 [Sesamum angolense]|uniref:p-hydroxybenzoic acid efflux pump subunit n=1 Tax=Sesamum angolense TaxID=2727404 RepID=A0AAE1WF25_9LAMI|nr:hypothetical protein Sango_2001300 [Sesamum angolense]
MASTIAGRSRIAWRMRLNSAVRTATACAIVGGATIYGPKPLVSEIKFAAFSYLTAVIIVSDASLGDTLKGCWHAFCATVQVVPLAMLARWIMGPTGGLQLGLVALVVAVAAFLVALPECTHLTAKRIAFGQIVLVCSDAVIGGGASRSTAGFMHPVYVAASTGLGALASVLALLVPYPGLAHSKVRKLCEVYAENASQRMNIYLRTFRAEDDHAKMELISQAKPLSETGAKLLQSIRILQEGMQWERPWSRCFKHNSLCPGDRLERVELQMRGIEYSLVSSPAFPVQVVDQEQLSNVLKGVSVQLEQKMEQVTRFSPSHSMTEPETRGELMEKPLLPLDPMFPMLKFGWVLFYFSCIDMLLNDAAGTCFSSRELQNRREKTEFSIVRAFKTWILKLVSKERLRFAFKCSLALGLAMLFGLIFDKENGCWAGLTLAISFVQGRQAVFTVANTRGQGTAIGSVYGVIWCFLFHHEELRLLALLPWIIFTSFLRYSKMYGQTGGVSAAIGALLILGRKNYGEPNEFAIVRLTEVFIGLTAFLAVELLLQPIRAATLAKNHLRQTLHSLRDCLKEISTCPVQKNQTAIKFHELRDKQRNLSSLVCELKKIVADAEFEPDFWYLPFRTSCYQKLVGHLSNIVDMLYFITSNFERLSDLSETSTLCKEFQEQMSSELELFQETLSSSVEYLEKAHSIESQADSQEAVNEEFRDLEARKLQNPDSPSALITENNEVETNNEEVGEDNRRQRQKMIQCLGALGFCISSLVKEIDETEICRKEIDQWESH